MSKSFRTKRLDFYASDSVHWKQGFHIHKTRWHSCMQWGWDAIHSGRRLEWWRDYIIIAVCFRRRGASLQIWPRKLVSKKED